MLVHEPGGAWWLRQGPGARLRAQVTIAALGVSLAALALVLFAVAPAALAVVVAIVAAAAGLGLGWQWARVGTGRVGASPAGVVVQEGVRLLQARWQAVERITLEPRGRRVLVRVDTAGEQIVTRSRFDPATARRWLRQAAALAGPDAQLDDAGTMLRRDPGLR